MARTTHDRIRDHEGTDLDSNIILDGATTNYTDGEDLHTVIADLDTRAGTGGSSTSYVAYAECNTSPSGTQHITFDTFYDVSAGTIGSLPAGIGLTWNSGTKSFDVDEDGVWWLEFSAEITASPTVTGTIDLPNPQYGYAPLIRIASSGNVTPQTMRTTIPAHSGDAFYVSQTMSGSHVFINGYAVLTIIRLAGAIA